MSKIEWLAKLLTQNLKIIMNTDEFRSKYSLFYKFNKFPRLTKSNDYSIYGCVHVVERSACILMLHSPQSKQLSGETQL